MCALGQQSLSGHLFQSMVWTLLFAPYLLDLGGSALAAVLAGLAVWVVSVPSAQRLDRRRQTGPAEVVLRRLAYGLRAS